ncbi:hypothetical protein BGX31_006351, partial [Mortierella sp. GBA43]
MKPLSKAVTDDATVLLRQGKSSREVAKTLGISIGSALRIRKEEQENIPEPKMGRPWKVSKTTRRHIAREYNTGNITTLREGQQLIKSTEGIHVHARTVDKYTKMEGLRTY